MSRRDWIRDELIVAFNLYCKIPFGKIHIRNPLVIDLAKAIGRSPSAVSWKLANFARLDPALQERKIRGATHGARAEAEIWNEFNNDWDRLAFESERLLSQMTRQPQVFEEATSELPAGMTRETIIRARVNQNFFRAAVLASYDGRCCITGLSIQKLLTASHIVPWSIDTKNRTNPRNGLCLNALHDRAFDCGLLTITTDLTVKLSPRVARNSIDRVTVEFLGRYDGASISLPRRFVPAADFLRYHNDKIFLAS